MDNEDLLYTIVYVILFVVVLNKFKAYLFRFRNVVQLYFKLLTVYLNSSEFSTVYKETLEEA